jgi:hypothetical protein
LGHARLQARILAMDAPPDPCAPRSVGRGRGWRGATDPRWAQCAAEFRRKALDGAAADAFNARAAAIWPELRR